MAGDDYWIQVAGLAEYRFALDSVAVYAVAQGDASAALVEEGFHRIVHPLALQLRGYEVLHASAVILPAGIAALCGVSGTGKSSLAYALMQRGYPPVADDALVVRPGEDTPSVEFVPFTLKVVPSAKNALVSLSARPSEQDRLAAIFLLARDESVAGPVVERVPPSQAFTRLLEHGYGFTLADSARTRSMMESYLRLAETVPVLDLRFRTDFSGMPQLADAVVSAVEAES